MYEWEDTLSIKEVSFTLAETEVKAVPAITELRAAVWDLSHKTKLMAKSSRLDALGSMDHLWKSIPRPARELSCPTSLSMGCVKTWGALLSCRANITLTM